MMTEDKLSFGSTTVDWLVVFLVVFSLLLGDFSIGMLILLLGIILLIIEKLL